MIRHSLNKIKLTNYHKKELIMIAHGFYTRNGLILTDCLLFGFYIILINFTSIYFIVKKNIVIVLLNLFFKWLILLIV